MGYDSIRSFNSDIDRSLEQSSVARYYDYQTDGI